MTGAALQTQSSMKPALRAAAWIVLFGLIGGVLSCLIAGVWAYGGFTRWQKLPALPEPPAHLAGATVNEVTAAGDLGQLFTCRPAAPESCWQATDSAANESTPNCADWAGKVRSPRGTLERLEACQDMADAGATAVYVLRQDGSVWARVRFDSAYSPLLVLVCAPLGALAGMLAGLLIWLFRLVARREGR